MGNCAAPQSRKDGVGKNNWQATAKIIHLDGRLQELKHQMKAKHILSQNPDCFLCNSESMFVGSRFAGLPEEEELQVGQIYFLMPLSKSQAMLTIQELCSLAVKASSAISFHVTNINGVGYYPVAKTSPRRL